MPGTQARELKRAYGFDEVSIVPGQVVDAQRLCPLKCQGKMSSK